ncbi:MAG: phosphomannomutase/phosphoglucomutase [Patescibacteria group bacterium]|jgi:phosphomannomutase
MNSNIFKAYDIRGVYPDDMNEDDAYAIAQAYAQFVKPKKIALGKDVRTSGPSMWNATAQGLINAGVDVVDIGTVSTDMMYFAAAYLELDGGISVTASHNPREYTGMKMVREKAIPISGDTGIQAMQVIAEKGGRMRTDKKGAIMKQDILEPYVDHCLAFIDPAKIKKLRVVANANFGMAGIVAQRMIAKGKLPLEVTPLNFEPDGTFPKGRPDPLVPENRDETSELVKQTHADFAVSWDADADRCFFFDESGNFIDGYYIVALLASIMLRTHPGGGKVIIDPRMVFATRKAIQDAGGTSIMNKVGHTFIKERMRKEDAIFAGENSAHLYFRDNYYCDNGMIPFLLILQELSVTGKKISELVKPWTDAVKVSGEINFTVKDVKVVIAEITKKFNDGDQNTIDGLSVEYPASRFNVRGSNTEPLLRLNTEAYTQKDMETLRDKVMAEIQPFLV